MTRRSRRRVRQSVLLAAGLTGIFFETLYSLRFKQSPDGQLVLLFAAMVGLPFFGKVGGDDDDDDRSGRRGGGGGNGESK